MIQSVKNRDAITLDDKYSLESGRIYLSGLQALVRISLMQHQRDIAAGLNTAGFISGYRGSPLGGLDMQLWAAKKFLQENAIHFEPGVNEDLAATAVWGSQQNDIFQDSRYDGVFGMWYGKGPGVDRSSDVLRHANLGGTARNGGVLAVAGDDHMAKSSTTAHQSEYAFMDFMMPVLHPAGIQDILDYGLYGWALSRFSGTWVALKLATEIADSTVSCYVDPNRVTIKIPKDFEMPPGGLNVRWPDALLDQEERLHRYKLPAVEAFCRVNRLDRMVVSSPERRLGIVATGKAYLDVEQALEDLGLDTQTLTRIGVSLYKVAMPWPLEPEGFKAFAEGLERILVVEEKRPLMEDQIKSQLYSLEADRRPEIWGKTQGSASANHRPLLPVHGELSPGRVARAIAQFLKPYHESRSVSDRLAFLDQIEKAHKGAKAPILRPAYFCSGCPHNTSTKIPEGSRALAGIGCHYMVQWMERETATFSQMGGEGVPWIGQAPFCETKHVFVNLGDGTYQHSGILAIRAAVAAGVNVTYKILYNDAVAMTGGQAVEGRLDPAIISRQLHAEGVKTIQVVSDEPDKYPTNTKWAPGVTIHHRDHLDRLQRELREVPGVTALIYDQTCAAEKRRRRKRGLYPDPAKRVVINEQVCEGCGDCSVKSNCLSVVPVETEYGTKRQIDQSSCNKDYSCLNGFCPSFVTVEGGALRKSAIGDQKSSGDQKSGEKLCEVLPEPGHKISLDSPYNILVTGIGGTGVVTIGALLGMAAHLEGKGCQILDVTGLAQKGGAVTSHVRLGNSPENLHALHISSGNMDLLLASDIVVAGAPETLSYMSRGKTRAIVNTHKTVTADFTRHSTSYQFPDKALMEVLENWLGQAAIDSLEATDLATALLGDSIASNVFLLGYAWQKGLIPLEENSILQAITLNGVAVGFNTSAFTWGRRAAHDLGKVRKAAHPEPVVQQDYHTPSATLDEVIARRITFLKDYQNDAYATQYKKLMERVKAVDQKLYPETMALSDAVARYAFKLMAYKDEYEVARLYSLPEYRKSIDSQFTGKYKLRLHLAPPVLARRDHATGQLKKSEFGPWILKIFAILARLKGLRGTAFDPFGHMAERKAERRLRDGYIDMIDELLSRLTKENYDTLVALAKIPDEIRGYGHIKQANMKRAEKRQKFLLEEFADKERSAGPVAAE